MIIVSPKYGTITLQRIDPLTIPAPFLSDSDSYFCEHDFGTIMIQNYHSHNFFIRFAVLRLVKKISFFIHEEVAAFKSMFSMNDTITTKTRWRKLNLRKGEYLITNSRGESASHYFINKGQYQIFESAFSIPMLNDLFEAFPTLKNYLTNSLPEKQVIKIETPRFASAEMKKIVNDLLDCPYDQRLRRLYFENRINDLLFEMLVPVFEEQVNVAVGIGQKEFEALTEAKQIILKDITKHYSIKTLSQMVNLNVLKLKLGFKQTFGSGIFEYLLQARMKKAYQLVTETDTPIKEIAALTGFEYVANFIKSFHRHFGKTPGELRRN